MNDFNNKNLDYEEKVIADEVADEILTVEEDEDRWLFFLILIFLICLIFLVSSLSFAIFNTYYNGDSTNVINVGTDIVVNRDKEKKEKDNNDNNNSSNTDDNNKKPTSPKKHIEDGSIIFSFNEQSNYIYMTDVYPTKDEVGKMLTGDKEYFDFNISAALKNIKSGKIVYEISLIPLDNNTLNQSDIRVYLTEDGKEVSINNNMVNTYSNLPDSEFRPGAKVIYRKSVSGSNVSEYVFRMWLSYNAKVSKVSKQFGCKVAVDAYYE